jgi:hypothetical protein
MIIGSRRLPSIDQLPKKLDHAAPAEINDDLMVLHAFGALYRT